MRASRSMSVTSPRSTWAFFWPDEDLARRRRDLALGEDAGRHLVEQRLEQVVGGLRDHRDVDVGASQRLGAEQAPEAGADHDHPVPVAGGALHVRHDDDLSLDSGSTTRWAVLVPIFVPCLPQRISGSTPSLPERSSGSRIEAGEGPGGSLRRGRNHRADRPWSARACRPGCSGQDGRVSTHFDLAIIGTGSGNSLVDERFADRSVAILEKGTFGGTCLNVGLHPHEDVRLPRRPGPAPRATAPRSASRPASRGPVGGRSGTGSSAGSTRSPTAATTGGRATPT